MVEVSWQSEHVGVIVSLVAYVRRLSSYFHKLGMSQDIFPSVRVLLGQSASYFICFRVSGVSWWSGAEAFANCTSPEPIFVASKPTRLKAELQCFQ